MDEVRVALTGVYHESNTFIPEKTTYQNFSDSHLLTANRISDEYREAHHEIGGILEVFESSNVAIQPLFFAEATPGGAMSKEAYESLYSEILLPLKQQGPWDGVMICAHGAAVAEGHPDVDGDIFAAVRNIVGENVPIVATIDPHANVSDKMIGSTDAIVAYSTNPHLDQRETGRKAAKLMLRRLVGKKKLTQAGRQSRVSISIEQQATSNFPCRLLYDRVVDYQRDPEVLSISVVLGFPYADVEKMGSSFIVVTEDNLKKSSLIASSLVQFLEENRHQFTGDLIEPDEAVRMIFALKKPVLMLDMGDNVGGGSSGDSMVLVHAIRSNPDLKYVASIYDPEAVAACQAVGENMPVQAMIGGKTDGFKYEPCLLDFTVKKLADGVFSENEPRHGGQAKYNMGKIAIVETNNGSSLLLMSKRIPPFSLKQLTTFGIDPKRFDVVVAKGVHAPVAAYGPVCPSIIWVNTPGLTCADVTQLNFHNRRRPLFPFDDW